MIVKFTHAPSICAKGTTAIEINLDRRSLLEVIIYSPHVMKSCYHIFRKGDLSIINSVHATLIMIWVFIKVGGK